MCHLAPHLKFLFLQHVFACCSWKRKVFLFFTAVQRTQNSGNNLLLLIPPRVHLSVRVWGGGGQGRLLSLIGHHQPTGNIMAVAACNVQQAVAAGTRQQMWADSVSRRELMCLKFATGNNALPTMHPHTVGKLKTDYENCKFCPHPRKERKGSARDGKGKRKGKEKVR